MKRFRNYVLLILGVIGLCFLVMSSSAAVDRTYTLPDLAINNIDGDFGTESSPSIQGLKYTRLYQSGRVAIRKLADPYVINCKKGDVLIFQANVKVSGTSTQRGMVFFVDDSWGSSITNAMPLVPGKLTAFKNTACPFYGDVGTYYNTLFVFAPDGGYKRIDITVNVL